MATPAVIGFHNATGIEERNKVLLRIQQGTKASSPAIRSYRRQHLDIYQPHATLPDNSTGSKNRPFYASKGESSFSSDDMKMRGGVLSTKEGQKYGKFILNRRANDIRAKDLVAQGIEPSSVMPSGDLVLTPDESKALELNNLLQGVSDAIEASDFSGLTINDLKNIPRLMITTLPTMTDRNFAELFEFIREMTEELEAIINPKSDRADDEEELRLDTKSTNGAKRIYEYLSRLLVLLREYAKVMGSDDGTKIATLRALVNEYLGIRRTTAESIIPKAEKKVVREGTRARIASPPPSPPRSPPPSPPLSRAPSGAPSGAPSSSSSRAPSRPPSPPRVVDDDKEAEDEEDEDSKPSSRKFIVLPAGTLDARKAEREALLTQAEREEREYYKYAYSEAGSKVLGRSLAGLQTLRDFARSLGIRNVEELTRVVLKNKINKSPRTKVVI